ncbi:DUF7529 family protein [Halomarina litorea]|uniref:DUF7529 family protein n=1 Tax=Halomarina litorea TaxID=2961595 RepID=UPI0020C25E3F|nr:hypothetical protein [Halomarina sp. BCD28]
MRDGDHPLAGATDRWEQTIDDMAVTAADYREAGYEVLELHPGDVTVRDDGGFDVLLPDDEFADLEDLVGDAALSKTEVYFATDGGVAFVLTVVAAPDDGVAVCCPLYYDLSNVGGVAGREVITLYARPLADDRSVAVQFDDPSLFVPRSGGEE